MCCAVVVELTGKNTRGACVIFRRPIFPSLIFLDGKPAADGVGFIDQPFGIADNFGGARMFLDAEARITCAGSTGASDLAVMMQGQRAGTFPQAHFSKSTHHVKDEVVRRCAALMEQKIDMPPSMDVLAAEVGISVRQLDRRFNQAMGQSPSRYFRSMRLSYARWRLTHTTDRIAEIAADAGFSDSAHFYREFRKSYGTSPSLYRQSSNAV